MITRMEDGTIERSVAALPPGEVNTAGHTEVIALIFSHEKQVIIRNR